MIGDDPIKDYPTKSEHHAQDSISHEHHCKVLSMCTYYWLFIPGSFGGCSQADWVGKLTASWLRATGPGPREKRHPPSVSWPRCDSARTRGLIARPSRTVSRIFKKKINDFSTIFQQILNKFLTKSHRNLQHIFKSTSTPTRKREAPSYLKGARRHELRGDSQRYRYFKIQVNTITQSVGTK